jgi:excisionase family DNA binding protein
MTLKTKIATRREAAEFLRTTERTVDRMTRSGRLKSFRLGRGVRYWLADLEAMLAA